MAKEFVNMTDGDVSVSYTLESKKGSESITKTLKPKDSLTFPDGFKGPYSIGTNGEAEALILIPGK